MANILTSKIQVPSLPDDTLILKDAEARNDLSTALATATGNPLNFSTRSAQKANETVISLEPIQDLHGYDHPWPAGGGKNKFDPSTRTEGKAINEQGEIVDSSTGSYSAPIAVVGGQTYTYNGQSGSWDGDYSNKRIHAFVDGVWMEQITYERVLNDTPFSITFTVPSGANEIRISALYSDTNIQVESGSTATAYEPYSNICPIDGRTETSLVGCGKNIWGGERLADDIVTKVTGAVKDTTNKTITFSAENVNGKKLFTNPDENKRYTVILYGRNVNNNSRATNMSFKYSDGSIHNIEFQLYGSNSYAVAYSKEGKTLKGLFGYWGSMNTILYYDQCGVFEGILTADDFVPYVESNNLTIQFGEKVYGATVELEKGTVTVDREIADIGDLSWTYSSDSNVFYNTSLSNKKIGNANLISSAYKTSAVSSVNNMNNGEIKGNATAVYVYIKDLRYTDATTFAQELAGQKIVYELATPRTIQLTPNEISLLSGVNNISTDGDSISLTYRDGKVATLGDLEDTANNLQEQIDQNETMEDETTQLLYKLGVNNGLLFMEEV